MLLHWCFPIAGSKGLACQNAEPHAPSPSILMIVFESKVSQKVRGEINIRAEAKSSRESTEIVFEDNWHSTFVFHCGLFEHCLKSLGMFTSCSLSPSPPHPAFFIFLLACGLGLSPCNPPKYASSVPNYKQACRLWTGADDFVHCVLSLCLHETFVTPPFVFVSGSLWK